MHELTDPRIQQQRPPLPDNEDEKRRGHSRLRRRVLEGWWRRDLDDRIAEFFQPGTAERLGYRDQTRNLFRNLVDQLAQLYGKPPTIEHADADESKVADFENKMRAAELWSVMGRNQRQVVGMRESLIRVGYVPDPGVQFRVVPPDMVWCAASPDKPNDPNVVVEARVRTLDIGGKKQARWTWDVLDIRDEPIYRVLLPGGQQNVKKDQDITELVLGGTFSGADYPYLVNGDPVIPYVLYHAEGGGDQLWDAWTGKEIVEATIQISCLHTYWNYCVRDASFPLRGLAGGTVRGTATKGSNAGSRREIAADPTTMLMIDSEGSGPVQALQWGAGTDPERLQLAIDSYEQRCLTSSGISSSDLVQRGSESGYAISLKRSFIRERQQAMMPQLEAGDRRVLALAAALCNANDGASFPEDGWNLRYSQIPLTTEERAARVAEARAGIELGTSSIVDVVIAENPGWNRDEAIAWLERVQAESTGLRAVAEVTGTAAPAEDGAEPADATDQAAPTEEKAADTALNGAQVVAAMEIVQTVAAGGLPRDAGLSMLGEFFNLPRDAAERIMGAVGKGFRPVQPEQGDRGT